MKRASLLVCSLSMFLVAGGAFGSSTGGSIVGTVNRHDGQRDPWSHSHGCECRDRRDQLDKNK